MMEPSTISMPVSLVDFFVVVAIILLGDYRTVARSLWDLYVSSYENVPPPSALFVVVVVEERRRCHSLHLSSSSSCTVLLGTEKWSSISSKNVVVRTKNELASTVLLLLLLLLLVLRWRQHIDGGRDECPLSKKGFWEHR